MQPTPPCPAPRLLVADASVWAAVLLRVAIMHVICGFNYLCIYLFNFSPSYVALWDSKARNRPASESVSLCLESSLFFKTPFLGRISIPTSFFSLLIFYILSYLLSKTIGCLSRCLMSSAIIQKCFFGIFSTFKFSFDEFVGEKLVSPSYSSANLGPPLETWDLNSTTRVWTHIPCTGSTVLFFIIWTFIFCFGIAD